MGKNQRQGNLVERFVWLGSILTKRTKNRTVRSLQSTRKARLEQLETRELLAVSAVEYAALRENYAEFALPETMDEIHTIEIESKNLSLQALNDALEEAGSTKGDDLIVVRTTDSANSIKWQSATDSVEIELDPNVFGSVTIVALGSQQLTLDANGLGRAISVAAGNVAIGNVAFIDGRMSDAGACVYNNGSLTLKNCAISGGINGNEEGALLYSDGAFAAINVDFTDGDGASGARLLGSVSLTDCSVSNCSGTGISLKDAPDAILQRCVVSSNQGDGLVAVGGSLALSTCELSSNFGSGFVNSSIATISDSSFTGNGASGLVNCSADETPNISAVLTATRCIFNGNTSVVGAGLYNLGGSATLKNCAIYANVATEQGGGVYAAYREGLLNRTNITNCTVAGNVGDVRGGGISIDKSAGCSLYNTIVSQNLTKNGIGTNVDGICVSKNGLIGGNSEFVVAPLFNYSTARLTNADKLDLRLTKKSCAVNIGDKARVADGDVDLKGEARIYGSSVDAGAYEYRGTGETAPSRVLVVTTLADTFDPNDGATSLREALYWASASNSTITFASGLKGTIKLVAQLTVDTSVTITGDGLITLNAQKTSRVLLNESTSTLSGLTLTNGAASASGGLVYNLGALTLSSCSLFSGKCGVDAFGGLVYSSGSLTANKTTFKSALSGDALYLTGQSELTSCVVSNAARNGIYSLGQFSAEDCEIVSNTENGLVNADSSVSLTNTILKDNQGSGLYNIGTADLEGCSFISNLNSGIVNESVLLEETYSFSSVIIASHCAFKGNEAERGAGLRNDAGRVELNDCEFTGNYATIAGGGIYNSELDSFENAGTLTNCTIAGNYAGEMGGGVCVDARAFLLFVNNTIVSMNYTKGVDSNVFGEIASSEGSFFGGNPGFVVAPIIDPATGKLTNADRLDLRLTANSIALDLGDSTLVQSEVDLAGNKRVYGESVDPGAYEYQGTGEKSIESTYLVTTLDDTFDPEDGETSLREALYWANDSDKKITFSSELKGTIDARAQFVVSCDVAIDGGGRVVIDGQGVSRIFLAEGKLELDDIELVSGATSGNGGAIYAQDALILTDCSIAASSCGVDGEGGGVYALGDCATSNTTIKSSLVGEGMVVCGVLTMTDCALSDNAGNGLTVYGTASIKNTISQSNGGDGIYNEYGSLALSSVSLSNNNGAGLRNLGIATASACHFVDNKDSGLVNLSYVYSNVSVFSSSLIVYSSFVKGNASQANGAGVYNDASTLEMSNCEISANTAQGSGGGVYNYYRNGATNKTSLTNCTVAGNYSGERGGGVSTISSAFNFCVYNTIIAKNKAARTSANVEGSIAENICGIVGGNPCFVIDPIFSSSGEITNKDAFDLRLQRSSVAVDSGENTRAVGKYDLLGQSRIFNEIVDVGAYEYQPKETTRVTTLEDSFDLSDDEISLREAIYLAKDGTIITFDVSLQGTIVLNSTLETSADLILQGNGTVAISGNKSVVILNNSGDLRIANLTFADALNSDLGGAIYNVGALELYSCAFQGNIAKLGGAIYNGANGVLTIENTRFESNKGTTSGGAIYNSGSLVVENSEYIANTATSFGGAVYNAGDAMFVDSLIVKNSAISQGGGVYNAAGSCSFVNSTIAANDSTKGGGVSADAGTVKFYNTILATNTAKTNVDLRRGDGTVGAYNTISSYAFGGATNILYVATQPLFATGNYRLAQDSVAIDAGSNAFARQAGLGLCVGDLDGNERYIGESIDIGAYESDLAVDKIVRAGHSFELSVQAASGERVYWDLSGTGEGEFVEGASAFWTSSSELGFAPSNYILRAKIAGASGTTTQTITLQVVDVQPNVKVIQVDAPIENAVLFNVSANFYSAVEGRSWRIDWGDGSYYETKDLEYFAAGKIYESEKTDAIYSIELSLVGADGNDELILTIGSVFVKGAEKNTVEVKESVAQESIANELNEELAEVLIESFDDANEVEAVQTPLPFVNELDDQIVETLASVFYTESNTNDDSRLTKNKKRALRLLVE